MINLNRPGSARARKAAALSVALSSILFIAPAFFVGGRASAQETPGGEQPGVVRNENLEMVVKAGFGNLEVSSWHGLWVPFRVTISNQGPPINGRVVVHCESDRGPSLDVREYVKQVTIPTGSRQSVEVATFLNPWDDTTIRVLSDDRVVAETRVEFQRRYGQSQQLEIAVVDTDATTLNNITSTQVVHAPSREPFKAVSRPNPQSQNANASAPPPGANVLTPAPPQPPAPGQGNRPRQGQQGPTRPTFEAHPTVISPDDLPRDFVSYDPVDAVVINEAPLNQLNADQARALRLWVASGGLLVVTGGADMAGINASGLQEILPVEVYMASSSSTASLPELTNLYGPFESSEPLALMGARAKGDAQVLLGTADRPIVAERSFGSGLVRFVAINPKLNPYRGWGAAKELWVDLLLPAADTKPRNVNWITAGQRGNNRSSRWGIQNFLFRLAEVEPPSPKFFIIFLLLYVLIVGPINYLLLRWRRKTDLAWLTIPAVVLIFTAVSVGFAQLTRGSQDVVSDVSLVELHQREAVSRTLGGMLLMPASKGTQEVVFEGRDSYASTVIDSNRSSSASASGVLESERGQSGYVLRVPMTTWTSAMFQVRSLTDGVSPMVNAAESGGAVTISNVGDAQITKAIYLSPSGVSGIFDLGPGNEHKETLSSPPVNSFNRWYTSALGEDTDEGSIYADLTFLLDRQVGGDRAFRQDISQGFFETQMMPDALKRLERPILICFADKEPTPVKFTSSFKRRSKALYVIHL